MASDTLFAAVVADIAAVRAAYESAGLMRDGGRDSLGWALFGGGDGADRFRRAVLLADALVRNRVAMLVRERQGRSQIVVFGGNNVGKSTVVNVLAAASIAGTSPEGGHTRHAQGYAAGAGDPIPVWNPDAFRGFRQVPAQALSDADFNCYAITHVDGTALPDTVVLWDAPDCDSVGSVRYVASVVETATIADVLVYVTSVEKYAVNDLVEWVFDISEAGIPVLGCLNKTSRRDRELVLRKQEDDILPAMAARSGRPIPQLPMLTLRYLTDGEDSDLWGPDHAEAAILREAALQAAGERDDRARGRTALQAVRRLTDQVLAPALAEVDVREAWTATVGQAVAEFVSIYEDEYLTGETVIDPFTKLNVQLLELLNPNIPGLTEVMRGLRRIRQLPADILRLGWRLVVDRSNKEAELAPELRAYANAHRGLIRAVHEVIEEERAEPRHHLFWDRLAAAWPDQATRLAEDFERATERHIERTDAEIRAAARDILKALEARPGILRLLRTVRLSTEMGGLLIGFAIPGHGDIGHDLLDRVVIAPLMMSATGAAADYAVEGYVAQRRAEIVDKLRADAREIATSLYATPLQAIGDEVMRQIGSLGLDAALLERLPANLAALEQAV
jgi:hypothetical protein